MRHRLRLVVVIATVAIAVMLGLLLYDGDGSIAHGSAGHPHERLPGGSAKVDHQAVASTL